MKRSALGGVWSVSKTNQPLLFVRGSQTFCINPFQNVSIQEKSGTPRAKVNEWLLQQCLHLDNRNNWSSLKYIQ